MVTESDPPELLTQTVYVVELVKAFGVPTILPALVSDKPEGRDGETATLVPVPPLFSISIETASLMTSPIDVYVVLKLMSGAGSLTEI